MFFISQNVVLAKQPIMEEVVQVFLGSQDLSFGEGQIKRIQQGKFNFQIYNNNYDIINPIAFSFNESATSGKVYFYNPMTSRIESADMFED